MPGSDLHPIAWTASRGWCSISAGSGSSGFPGARPKDRAVPQDLGSLGSCDLGFPQLCGEAATGRPWAPSALTRFPCSEPARALQMLSLPILPPQKTGTPDLLRCRWAEPALGGTPAPHSHPRSSIDCLHPSARLFPSAVQLICLHPSNFIQPPNDLLEEPRGAFATCPRSVAAAGGLPACPAGAKPSPGGLRKGLGGRDATWMLFWRIPHPMRWGYTGWEKPARSLKLWAGLDLPSTQPDSPKPSARRFPLSDPSCLLTLIKAST